MSLSYLRPLVVLAPLLFSLAARGDENLEFFEKKIRPVLAKNCYACHSERMKNSQGNLLVDSREGLARGGKSGVAAVVPGKVEESLLIKAIRGQHKDLMMPPGKPLSKEMVADFEAWIVAGAVDPRSSKTVVVEAPAYDWEKEKKHWAYQPLRSVAAPTVKSAEWSGNAIDRFVKAKLDEKGLVPLGRASRQALIRRVTFGLTGLPPTPEEVSAFVNDKRPDAMARLIDRLLASPQYGEHWGRKWLDLVRYADTAGDASDFPVPEAYRYRNYVIRSFNADKPMDVFLREQIAGDTMKPKDDEDRRDKLVATGYLALSRRFGQTKDEFHLTLDDSIDNFSKVMLGLTAGCARCHDHKFDAIPTKDYYGLAGIFKSSKYAHAGLEHHQYVENFIALNNEDEERVNRAQQRMVDNYKIVKAGIGSAKGDPAKEVEWYKADAELRRVRQGFPELPMAFAVTEGDGKDINVMVKGEPSVPGPMAPRGFFTILGGQRVPADHKGSGRALLADWVLDQKNPLTARVLVNRVWLWHFGRGLVNTPNDFGTRGEKPSHPELLDYLATRFQQEGWSMKRLHREILLTRAWQTASGHNAKNAEMDAKNEYLWRFDRRRLTAEEVRDTLLAVTGELDPTPAGAHKFPPRGSYQFTQHHPFVADVKAFDHQKRSVYLIQQRFRRHPFLELFDGGDPNYTTASRATETTPLQSLYFFNDEFVHQRADALAVRIGMADATAPGRVKRAFELLFNRTPALVELNEAAAFLTSEQRALARAELAPDQKTRAALAGMMRTLIASNEFFYVD
jgi:hypothetical protein